MSAWEDQFAAAEGARAGEPGWLAARRRDALASFREQGFPHTRLEDWRYTNVSGIAKTDWEPGEPRWDALARERLESLSTPVYACNLYVFANGHFAADVSSPAATRGQVQFASLRDALATDPERWSGVLAAGVDPKGNAFAALNTALFADAALIRVPRGVDAGALVHLVFVAGPGSGPTVSHPRVAILAEEGSRATVVEDYVSLDGADFLTNATSEVRVEANASLRHVRLLRESAAGRHLSSLHVHQGRDARYAGFSLVLGGGLVRNDVEALLAGEGADCELDGLFLGARERHVDNQTLVDHAMPRTRSRELYKGILAGRSRGVFRGRVIVRPDAQKSDARQSNPNLLLSTGAEIDTKPQLEIYADDVKCSHGSSIGRIDEDALFFLRARGISGEEARALLVRAFASEITGRLEVEPLAERVHELVVEQVGGEVEA